MPTRQWYVINVLSGFEKKVRDLLLEKAAQQNLIPSLGEVLIPSEDVTEINRGKKVTKERQYFPGYILVQMTPKDELWNLIRSLPRVGMVLGAQGKPSPISSKEVDRIKQSMASHELSERRENLYEVGEMVKVTEGPFATFQGSIEEVDDEKCRVKVSVSIFGRATNIELLFSQISKLS